MSDCPVSVRIATENDSDPLFDFMSGAHEEMRYAAKDENKIRATIARATAARCNPVFGIIRGRGGIEGAVGLYFSEWWYSSDPVLMNFFFFVSAVHRRTDHAANLKGFSKWFAAQIRLPLVLVDWSDEETGKTRLFARDGKRVGAMFETIAA